MLGCSPCTGCYRSCSLPHAAWHRRFVNGMNGQPTWEQGSLWLNTWRKGREVRPRLLEPAALQVGGWRGRGQRAGGSGQG